VASSITENVDVILTGDNDFLESGIENPRIMTPGEFVKA
jgi:predicted nucleic acid-binding protein